MALQNTQEPELTQDPMSVDVVLEDVLDLLDSHDLELFVGAGAWTIFLLEFNRAFFRTRADGVFVAFKLLGLQNCAGGSVADDLLQLVVGFHLDGVIDFVLKASFLDLLFGFLALFEYTPLDGLELWRTSLCLDSVEFECLTELFSEHQLIFIIRDRAGFKKQCLD